MLHSKVWNPNIVRSKQGLSRSLSLWRKVLSRNVLKWALLEVGNFNSRGKFSIFPSLDLSTLTITSCHTCFNHCAYFVLFITHIPQIQCSPTPLSTPRHWNSTYLRWISFFDTLYTATEIITYEKHFLLI